MKLSAKEVLAQYDEGADEKETETENTDMSELGTQIGIDWESAEFTPEDLAKGFDVELEHGSKNSETNITDDDPVMTAKIAWAHLIESPKYYELLKKMEEEF